MTLCIWASFLGPGAGPADSECIPTMSRHAWEEVATIPFVSPEKDEIYEIKFSIAPIFPFFKIVSLLH